MKILLCIKDEIQANLSAFIETISHLSDCQYTLFNQSSFDTNCFFDIVLAVNKSSLINAKNIAQLKQIPLIYFFMASSAEQNYPESLSDADDFILIRDSSFPISNRFLQIISGEIRLFPSCCKEYDTLFTKEQNDSKTVLVAVSSELPGNLTLLQLLPSFNMISKLRFILTEISESISPLLNPHIKIVHSTSNELFVQADFIIANGYNVQKAITFEKPCIIVGDRGYGGILDNENFEHQYASFFEGRVGAELLEYVPNEFITHDILFLQQFGEDDFQRKSSEKLAQALNTKILENRRDLKTLLENVLKKHNAKKQKLTSQCLMLSKVFELVHYKNDCYIIKNDCKIIHSKIELDEMLILEAFQHPIEVSKVYTKFNKKFRKDNFLNFIKELLIEKILVFR